MKKIIFIALTVLAVCSMSVNANAQVTYFYDEPHCQDIYERYIPSGYFSGPQKTIIHYYGNGDFFVGYPLGNGSYEWDVVHMDFRPLHRMVLSRDRYGLAAVHILYINGQWVWSISYDAFGSNYPRAHYYGNHRSWHYCSSNPYSHVYYDWGYSYSNLVWRNNRRPSYYSSFSSHHGDCRRYQYHGNLNYGYRKGNDGTLNRTYNQRNSDDRRYSNESTDEGRKVLSREFETSKRGYKVGENTSTRQIGSDQGSRTTSRSQRSEYTSGSARSSEARTGENISERASNGRNSSNYGSRHYENRSSSSNTGNSGNNRRTETEISNDGPITRTTTRTITTSTEVHNEASTRGTRTTKTYDERGDIRRESGSVSRQPSRNSGSSNVRENSGSSRSQSSGYQNTERNAGSENRGSAVSKSSESESSSTTNRSSGSRRR